MDLLVLLVGTNPLPAWVTFSALHNHAPDDLRPRTVLLVHSSGTASQANRLSDRIARDAVPVSRVNVGDDAADPHEIRRLVAAAVDQHGPPASVHLDYTGGTKQMAVQAYAAVQQRARERGAARPACSYLDARSHQLRFDDGGVFPVARGTDLRSRVRITLGDLVELHGCELTKATPLQQAELHPWTNVAAGYFAAAVSDPEVLDHAAWWVWEQFVAPDRQLVDVQAANGPRRPPEGRVLSGKTLVERGSFQLPTVPSHAPLREGIARDLAVDGSDDSVRWSAVCGPGASQKQQRAFAEDFAAFLHGRWFETWFVQTLATQLPGDLRSSVATNVEIRRQTSDVAAELDVSLIDGYQLFVFSCTTTRNRGYAKQKAMEAIHRARQFGGDEARPVFVTLLPPRGGRDDASVAGIAADVETDMGDRQGIRIWGIGDLRNFSGAWRQLVSEERLS